VSKLNEGKQIKVLETKNEKLINDNIAKIQEMDSK